VSEFVRVQRQSISIELSVTDVAIYIKEEKHIR